MKQLVQFLLFSEHWSLATYISINFENSHIRFQVHQSYFQQLLEKTGEKNIICSIGLRMSSNFDKRTLLTSQCMALWRNSWSINIWQYTLSKSDLQIGFPQIKQIDAHILCKSGNQYQNRIQLPTILIHCRYQLWHQVSLLENPPSVKCTNYWTLSRWLRKLLYVIWSIIWWTYTSIIFTMISTYNLMIMSKKYNIWK